MLMAVDQESSIFWNSCICGLSAEVAADWGAVAAGVEAGFWATTKQQESRKTEKTATRRVISTMNSSQTVVRDQGSVAVNPATLGGGLFPVPYALSFDDSSWTRPKGLGEHQNSENH
jgi:hypothetical protein